jgi:hypothetical protein
MDYEQQGAHERDEGDSGEYKVQQQSTKKRRRKRDIPSTAHQSDDQGPYKHIHHVEGKNIEKPPAEDSFKATRESLPRPPPLVRIQKNF